MGYANDILVLIASNLTQACAKANKLLKHLWQEFAGSVWRGLLRPKRKPYYLAGTRTGGNPNGVSTIEVGDTDVPLDKRLKYLGVIINNVWNFDSHFSYVEEKVSRVVCALGRLMPNIRRNLSGNCIIM